MLLALCWIVCPFDSLVGELAQRGVISAKLGINLAEYWAIPKRERTSDTFLGGSICFRASTLLGDGFIPSFENTEPKNSI